MLSGKSDKEIFENKIFSITTFVGAVICLLSFFVNMLVKSYFLIDLILCLFGLVFVVFFYLSSFRGITKPLVLPFQIMVALALIASWFGFQGLEGSTTMFFFPAMFLLIYTYSGQRYWSIFIIFLILVLVLTGMHYSYPKLTFPYLEETSRVIDLSASFVISFFIFGYAIIVLKKNFDQERSNVQEKNRVLEMSEARFRDIAMISGDWIWEVDANSAYTYCSEKVVEILGYMPGEMIGKTPFDFMPGPESDKVRERFRQIVNEQKPFRDLENRNLTKTGQQICVLTSGVPVFDSLGNLAGYRGTDTDITERKKAEEALRHSHELMQYVIEHSNDGIAVHDRDLKYIYVSERYLDEYKLTDRNIIGKHHYEVFPDIPQKWREVHQKALAGEVSRADNDPYVRDDGSVEWTRWECRPWYELDGTIGGIIIYADVITERKHAELALSESESRFNQLAEHSRTIAWEVNVNGLYTYISHVSEELLGYSPDELVGKMHFYDHIPEGKREMVKAIALESFARRDSFVDFENLAQTKDGRLIWFSINGFPILDANNQLIGYRGSGTDITERKQAEEALKKSYELRNKLTEQVPGVVYQYRLYPDGRSCFPYSSQGMIDIYGVTSEEVREDATPVFGRLHPDDLEYIVSSIQESARTQELYHSEFRVILPGQGVRWRLCDAKPERMDDGSTLWYGIISDITERKQAEMELIEAKKKAEESDRLKSAFLANMSHEIRTPLNSILGFSELLVDPNSEKDKHSQYVRLMMSSGKNLLSIINDIMDISKIEAGQVQVRKSIFPAQRIIRVVQNEYNLAAQEKGLELKIAPRILQQELMIESDEPKLIQVLTNFVTNAIKFTEQGSIEIGLTATDDTVCFYVKDTGIGIPEEYHSSIFARFQQVENTYTRKYGGNGLGLAISKSLVELLGGKIGVESEPGKGSMFYFTISKS